MIKNMPHMYSIYPIHIGEALRNAVKPKDRLVKDHAEKGSICPCLISNGEETQLNEGGY